MAAVDIDPIAEGVRFTVGDVLPPEEIGIENPIFMGKLLSDCKTKEKMQHRLITGIRPVLQC